MNLYFNPICTELSFWDCWLNYKILYSHFLVSNSLPILFITSKLMLLTVHDNFGCDQVEGYLSMFLLELISIKLIFTCHCKLLWVFIYIVFEDLFSITQPSKNILLNSRCCLPMTFRDRGFIFMESFFFLF